MILKQQRLHIFEFAPSHFELWPHFWKPWLYNVQFFWTALILGTLFSVSLKFISSPLKWKWHFHACYRTLTSVHVRSFSALASRFPFCVFLGCDGLPVLCSVAAERVIHHLLLLFAARSSNLFFVWKASIIFSSMTHWPEASRRNTPSVFFLLWNHVFVLVKQLGSQKQPKQKKIFSHQSVKVMYQSGPAPSLLRD